jgi:hypothetical protein
MISSLSVSTTRWTVTQLGCSDDLHLSSYFFYFSTRRHLPYTLFCSVFDDHGSSGVGGGLIAWTLHDVGVFGHFQALHG